MKGKISRVKAAYRLGRSRGYMQDREKYKTFFEHIDEYSEILIPHKFGKIVYYDLLQIERLENQMQRDLQQAFLRQRARVRKTAYQYEQLAII